jgi:hypothetical protein
MRTPSPWRVGLNQNGGAHIVADTLVCQLPGGGYCGLELNEAGKAHSLADANFIVQACNSHDDLVKALTDAVNALSELATTLQPGSPAQQFADDAGFKGSAMLASIGK